MKAEANSKCKKNFLRNLIYGLNVWIKKMNANMKILLYYTCTYERTNLQIGNNMWRLKQIIRKPIPNRIGFLDKTNPAPI